MRVKKMHNGYIKAYRKTVHSPVFGDSKKFKLWFLCLFKATHTEHKQYIGNQIVFLGKGQFVTGRQSLAREYNKGEKPSEMVSEQTLWRWLKMFEKDGMLNINSSTKYSVITVLNWNYYQLGEQQMINEQASNEEQFYTNKNVNNVNNENNDKNKNNSPFWEIRMDEVP